MDDKSKCSPALSDGKPKLSSNESKSGMGSRKFDVKDISKHAKARGKKEDMNSDNSTMPSTSTANSKTRGKFSTCATPISMPSRQTSDREVSAPEKDAKQEGKHVILRTEKELRDYFAAMDRTATQVNPTPSPQPTRSCLSRSSFGSSRSGSGQSVKSVRFAVIDELDKRNKRSGKGFAGRRSRTLITGGKDIQPVPTGLHDLKTCSSIKPTGEHDNCPRQFKTENTSECENQPQTSSESSVSANSSKVPTKTSTRENISCSGGQDTKNRQKDKVHKHNTGRTTESASSSVSPRSESRYTDNNSRTDSLISSGNSYSEHYTSCSYSSIDENSRSESTCSSYSRDSRTPSSENSSRIEKCDSKSISRSYTIIHVAKKSPNGSSLRSTEVSSSGSTDGHSRSESGCSENNNSRCGSRRSDSKNFDEGIKNKGKYCRGRLSSPKQRNRPNPEDKVFRREPKTICPGTKTLKIDFQFENKVQQPHQSAIPKSGKPSNRLSPNTPTINCKNLDQAVDILSVKGVPLQKKETSESSSDPIEYLYDNDFEEDEESEKTSKGTPTSEKSQDNVWSVKEEHEHQVKSNVISESSKQSIAEFPLIKRSDKTDLIRYKKHKDPEPDRKSAEISMVGTGFDSLATGKVNVKPQGARKKDEKVRGNKIAREKQHVLENDPQDLSALIAKELLGDKYQARNKEKKERGVVNKAEARLNGMIPSYKQDKQNPAKIAKSKKIKVKSIVAADNLHQNNQHDHGRGMMVKGTAKSSPHLDQHPRPMPKACSTATILPTINTADDIGPSHSMVSGHTNQPPTDTILPKLSASRLILQHHEARGGDQRRGVNTVRMPCRMNHPHGDIDHSRRRPKERNPSQASDRTLPKLLGPPAPLHAEATLCNGALEVTIMDPSNQGGNTDPVNIKLTILHQSRVAGQSTRSLQNQRNYEPETEHSFLSRKGLSQKINTEMKSRRVKRGFSQH